jgi:hypothetical protein
MAAIHGSPPHPATCDKLATRDANRTPYPPARTLPPFGVARSSCGMIANIT